MLRDAAGVSIATGAYGISFGAISLAGGLDVWQTMALSLLMFTGGSQFGLVGVVAGGGAPLAGAATAIMPRRPQRAVRAAAGRAAGPAWLAPVRRGPADHRRVDRDVDRPGLAAGGPLGLLLDRASGCSRCGTWAR